MQEEERQVTLSDLDTSFGKMSPEHLAAMEDETSYQSSKHSRPSANPPYQYLNLKETARPITLFGLAQEASWETVGASLGERLMRNTGECPSVVRESTLSQILQADAPEKYYLSPTACEGICRRAMKRGKKLPLMLWEALMEVLEQ